MKPLNASCKVKEYFTKRENNLRQNDKKIRLIKDRILVKMKLAEKYLYVKRNPNIWRHRDFHDIENEQKNYLVIATKYFVTLQNNSGLLICKIT